LWGAAAAFAAGAVLLPAAPHADEGGTSFWVPGTFGSFAAVPETPGWSLTITNYFTSTNAGDDVATARDHVRENKTDRPSRRNLQLHVPLRHRELQPELCIRDCRAGRAIFHRRDGAHRLTDCRIGQSAYVSVGSIHRDKTNR